MRVSAVIPSWNDAPWLERLANQIKTSLIDEILVMDNDSTDDTPRVAALMNAKIFHGGRPGEARNRGAKLAQGEWLLFADADVLPTEDAMRVVKSLDEFENASIVLFRVKPLSNSRFVVLCYFIADQWFRALSKINVEQGFVSFAVVRRRDFESVGGFDETLEPGEDVELVRRLGRVGRVLRERSAVVYVSPRRFEIEGRYTFPLKVIYWEFCRLLNHRGKRFPYKWHQYTVSQFESEAEVIEKLKEAGSL